MAHENIRNINIASARNLVWRGGVMAYGLANINGGVMKAWRHQPENGMAAA